MCAFLMALFGISADEAYAYVYALRNIALLSAQPEYGHPSPLKFLRENAERLQNLFIDEVEGFTQHDAVCLVSPPTTTESIVNIKSALSFQCKKNFRICRNSIHFHKKCNT